MSYKARLAYARTAVRRVRVLQGAYHAQGGMVRLAYARTAARRVRVLQGAHRAQRALRTAYAALREAGACLAKRTHTERNMAQLAYACAAARQVL